MASTKTTANETVKDIDPGGTRPAKGERGQEAAQHTETGDRNARPDPHTTPEH
jgi:hypothetical protein